MLRDFVEFHFKRRMGKNLKPNEFLFTAMYIFIFPIILSERPFLYFIILGHHRYLNLSEFKEDKINE